jgi:hypothetical protein
MVRNGKEYITFEENYKDKVVSHGAIKVNESSFSNMLLWLKIFISIFLRLGLRCVLRRAYRMFWTLDET